jgi:hypothetical protein
MVPDLRRDTTADTDRQKSLEVISRERICTKYEQWQQGYSPKEHDEMLNVERLRDWQSKREEEERRYRDQQRKEDLNRLERHSQREMNRDESASWRFWIQMIITVILAVVAALVGRLQK